MPNHRDPFINLNHSEIIVYSYFFFNCLYTRTTGAVNIFAENVYIISLKIIEGIQLSAPSYIL